MFLSLFLILQFFCELQQWISMILSFFYSIFHCFFGVSSSKMTISTASRPFEFVNKKSFSVNIGIFYMDEKIFLKILVDQLQYYIHHNVVEDNMWHIVLQMLDLKY